MLLHILFAGRGQKLARPFVLVALFLATAFLILCIPSVVGSRLVWPAIVSRLTAELDADVTTGGVSLGWFSPIVVKEVTVNDTAGASVLTIEQVRCETTLLSLLLDRSDLGKIVLERPELQLRVRPAGSNLEDVLAAYLSAPDSHSQVSGLIEISDGSVLVEADRTDDVAPLQLRGINAVVTFIGGSEHSGSFELQQCRTQGGRMEGTLAATARWQAADAATDWSVVTDFQSLDLSLLQMAARRWDWDLSVAGVGNVKTSTSWDSATGGVTVDLQQLELRQFQLAWPEYLDRDTLNLERVAVRGICHEAGGVWAMSQVTIDSSVGSGSIDGQFAWSRDNADSIVQQFVAAARGAELEVSGNVDLAALAATLPQTLKIRHDARIESGKLNFTLQGGSRSGSRRWTAAVDAADLAARRGDQRFTWSEPLRVALEATSTADSWHVERLACESSFLSLTGGGTSSSGSFSMQCDLHRLSSQLREFFELGSWDASGNMSAQLEWERSADRRVKVHGTGLLEKLDVSGGSYGRWRESQLSVVLAIEGQQHDQQMTRIESAGLRLASHTDELEVELLEPVDNPGRDASWIVGCHVSGHGSTWFQRLRPLLPQTMASDAWTVSGPVDLQLTVRGSGQQIQLEQGKLTSEPFLFDTPQIRIDEPALAVELQGSWDRRTGRVRIPEATFQSVALAFRITDLRTDPVQPGQRRSGDITFRADLNRLYETWRVPAKQHDWRLAGSAEGQISLAQSDDTTRARWSVDFVGLELNRRRPQPLAQHTQPASRTALWATVWNEPILKAAGSGQFDQVSQTLRVDRFDVDSADKLQLSLRGTLAEPIGTCNVDLEGQITYDLARLLEHWAPELTNQIQWSGQDTQPLWLRGPLFHVTERTARTASAAASAAGMIPLALEGEAGLSWQAANVFGIGVGSGALAAKLDRGSVRTGVVQLPISGGTMRVEPTVLLNSQPPMVSIAAGQVLSNVQFTRAMCDRWLKYIAPIAAQATQAEGTFSMQLGEMKIPLRTPSAMRCEGTLDVHAANLGPGPLAQQMIGIAQQINLLLQRRLGDLTGLDQPSWVRIPAAKTRFWIADQRVHHDSLAFELGQVVMYTSGTVGFDQSLALTAQIPIRDQWITANPELAPLRGQVLQLPISGTLTDPRVDQRAVERLAADAIRQTTGRVLENELRKGLQRWLDPER